MCQTREMGFRGLYGKFKTVKTISVRLSELHGLKSTPEELLDLLKGSARAVNTAGLMIDPRRPLLATHCSASDEAKADADALLELMRRQATDHAVVTL